MSIVPKQTIQTIGLSNRNQDLYSQVAGKYVHERNSSCYLELLSNGSYVLFEDAQVHGTYEISGSEITLFVARRPTSKARIAGDSIIDEQGDRWTRPHVDSTAAPPAPPAAPPEKHEEPAVGIDIIETLPTSESVLELEPEALGGYLLESLSAGNSRDLRLENLTSRIRAHYKESAVYEAFLEAWAWLVREGLLLAAGNDTYVISRRGKKLKGRQDLEAFRKSNILPKGSLHPVIADRVWPDFIRGEYETAVFQAFKEVESAVRTAGRFQATDVGTDLVQKAFDPVSGSLTDMTLPEAERQATFALFSGALGVFKNPSSFRHTTLKDPKEAAEMIALASLLMRAVDSRRR